MALTAQQQQDTARYWINQHFVIPNATANFSLSHVQDAAAAIDNAFDATLNQAVAAVGGNTTIINGLASVIPAPFNTASAQLKTLLACYVLMKRAGLI